MLTAWCDLEAATGHCRGGWSRPEGPGGELILPRGAWHRIRLPGMHWQGSGRDLGPRVPEGPVHLEFESQLRLVQSGPIWWVSELLPEVSLAPLPRSVQLSVEGPHWASGRLRDGRWHTPPGRAFGVVGGALEPLERGQVLFLLAAGQPPEPRLSSVLRALRELTALLGPFPYPELTVLLGDEHRQGGTPLASGLLALHGGLPVGLPEDSYWPWLAGHELAHQYFGEHRVSSDWLTLGCCVDILYCRRLGIEPVGHRLFSAGSEHARSLKQAYQIESRVSDLASFLRSLI